MNEQLQSYARKAIKDGLEQLPDGPQRTFKLLYGRNQGKRTVEETVAMSVNEVVDEMPADKLDWAMDQVNRSLAKLEVK